MVSLYFIHNSDKAQAVLSIISKPSTTPTGVPKPDYYTDITRPIFLPIEGEDKDTADFCSNFPSKWLERVQVVMKTGIGQREKTVVHLDSASSCIRNMLIFSDLEEHVGQRHFIDILRDLPVTYHIDPSFAPYYAQQKANLSGKVSQSDDGWKLDRFKFLPMVNAAYEMNPHAEWYVFFEADVYFIWDSLFRLLEQMNPHEMHYMGAAAPGYTGKWFGYGGAGFVLSQGLMNKLVGDGTKLSERYEDWIMKDCCGDAVLGYVILDKTGVKLEDVYPMFSGEDIDGVKVDEQRWCEPLISLHRMSVAQLQSLWQWERTRRILERPLVFSDLIEYRQPFLRTISTKSSWDNLSNFLLPAGSEAHSSSMACEKACENDAACLQYSYTRKECRTASYVVHGYEVGEKDIEFLSGWDRNKISKLGLSLINNGTIGCENGIWKTPVIHKLN